MSCLSIPRSTRSCLSSGVFRVLFSNVYLSFSCAFLPPSGDIIPYQTHQHPSTHPPIHPPLNSTQPRPTQTYLHKKTRKNPLNTLHPFKSHNPPRSAFCLLFQGCVKQIGIHYPSTPTPLNPLHQEPGTKAKAKQNKTTPLALPHHIPPHPPV